MIRIVITLTLGTLASLWMLAQVMTDMNAAPIVVASTIATMTAALALTSWRRPMWSMLAMAAITTATGVTALVAGIGGLVGASPMQIGSTSVSVMGAIVVGAMWFGARTRAALALDE